MILPGDSIVNRDAPYSEDLGLGDTGIEGRGSPITTPGRFAPHNRPYLASTPEGRVSTYPLHTSNTSEGFLLLEEVDSISHYHLSLAAVTSRSIQLNSSYSPYTCHTSLNYFALQGMEGPFGFSQPANMRSATLTDGDTFNTFHEYKRARRRIVSMHSPPWGLHNTGHSQEEAVLEFIASRNGACPFLTRVTVKRTSAREGHPHIQLGNYPTSLAHPQVAAQFRLHSGSGTSTIRPLRLLAAELCLALLFLHRNGIVHRDIRPANIMISKNGHATLGGYGAARFVRLPSFTSQDRFRKPFSPDVDWASHGPVTLLSDANAYLDLAHTNYLSEYHERDDWRSLGRSLCEVIIGGILSEDPIVLQSQVEMVKEADVPLLHFLQSLLSRDPAIQLYGEDALSHPFFCTVRDLWDEIEDLKHPPCRHPPSLSFGSQFHATAKDLGGPCYALRLRKPSCDTSSTDTTSFTDARSFNLGATSLMPPFSPERRKEASEVGRSTARIFENADNFTDDHPISYDTESSIVHQEIFLSSNHFTPNPGMDATSIMEPCVSTAHIIRFFQHDDSKPSLQEESENGECGYCDIVLGSTERSFNDSGLGIPLGDTPEFWGPRKDEELRKLERLQLVSGEDAGIPSSQPTVKCLLPPISSLIPGRSPMPTAEKSQRSDEWTLDQRVAISLLCAGMEKSEPERRAKQRGFGRVQRLIARASAKIFSAVKRRTSKILRDERPGVFKD